MIPTNSLIPNFSLIVADGREGHGRIPVVPLSIGPYEVAAPVVLAPMAGITNQAFRRLCREYGAGFYVSEMITSAPCSSATTSPCA